MLITRNFLPLTLLLLLSIGGKRVLELFCADEATGLEETVEKWKSEILKLVDKIVSTSKSPNCLDPSSIEVECQKPINCTLKPTAEVENLVNCDIPSVCYDDPVQTSLPKHIYDYNSIIQYLELNRTNILTAVCPPTLLPRSKTSSTSSIVFPLPVSYNTPANNRKVFDGWTSEAPFKSQVINAKYLTLTNKFHCPTNDPVDDWGKQKRVIKLELSLENSNIEYHPGDSIGICCPNPDYHVKIIFNCLKKYYSSASIEISLQSIVHDTINDTYSTLEEILAYR